MASFLLIARLFLGLVFAVAALAKLLDQPGIRRALNDFGVPKPLVPATSVMLPVIELAVAVGLFVASWARWSGAVSLGLLLVFTGAVAFNLVRGRRPACHCFGQIQSGPVGSSTLIRNVLLMALAALVVGYGPGPPTSVIVSGLAALGWAQIAVGSVLLLLAVAVTVEGWLLVGLLRQNGRILLRLEALESAISGAGQGEPAPHGLPVGTPAPGFDLPSPEGSRLTLEALTKAGKPVLLLFSDPDCAACDALLPEITFWQREHGERISIAVISRAGDEARGHPPLRNLGAQADQEVASPYRVPAMPSAVAVNTDGTIASPLAVGPEAIRALLTQALAERLPALGAENPAEPVHVPTRGEPAPDLALPDLRGEVIDLGSFRGSETVMLFWNPACGFCQDMLPDLKDWVASRNDDPKLLVVSSGSVEDNLAMGLEVPVVLDASFSAGRAFGAQGTPAAVVVDREGRIASDLAVGRDEVLRLLESRRSRRRRRRGAASAN